MWKGKRESRRESKGVVIKERGIKPPSSDSCTNGSSVYLSSSDLHGDSNTSSALHQLIERVCQELSNSHLDSSTTSALHRKSVIFQQGWDDSHMGWDDSHSDSSTTSAFQQGWDDSHMGWDDSHSDSSTASAFQQGWDSHMDSSTTSAFRHGWDSHMDSSTTTAFQQGWRLDQKRKKKQDWDSHMDSSTASAFQQGWDDSHMDSSTTSAFQQGWDSHMDSSTTSAFQQGWRLDQKRKKKQDWDSHMDSCTTSAFQQGWELDWPDWDSHMDSCTTSAFQQGWDSHVDSSRDEEKVSKGVVAKERWIKHYSSHQDILLVGEGDFSFSACLALAFGSANNMIATSLNSEGFLRQNYRNARSNIENLRSRGCKVMHGVDATKMAYDLLLEGMEFDRIIFNFPHSGFLQNESRESQLGRHTLLVYQFLANAKKMITKKGEIHISHKSNGFFLAWNVEFLALQAGLGLIEAVDFNLNDYPGYDNKYGFGGDKNFNCNPSKTYKFGLRKTQKYSELICNNWEL